MSGLNVEIGTNGSNEAVFGADFTYVRGFVRNPAVRNAASTPHGSPFLSILDKGKERVDRGFALMVDLIPDFSSRVFLAVGGILGALCSFLFGPVDDAIEWLFVFIVVDYLSGTYAAMKTGQWNSRTGFLGITKKIVMLSLVALCHGLDITSVIPFVSVRDAAVFAFCLNDFGSILENIERMGYGSIIPAPIRKMLKAMEERSEAMASDVVSGGEIHRQHRDK